MLLLTIIQTLFRFHQFFHDFLFLFEDPVQCTALPRDFMSSNLLQSVSFYFFLLCFTALRSVSRYFVECPLVWVCLIFFFQNQTGMIGLWKVYHKGEMPFSAHQKILDSHMTSQAMSTFIACVQILPLQNYYVSLSLLHSLEASHKVQPPSGR